MQRKNGYIDILELLGIEVETVLDGTDDAAYHSSLEIYEKLQANRNVHFLKHELGLRVLFSFEYGDETYFFKYESMAKPINELFAYEVATKLGIDCVSYDLAVLGPYRGVISKNFKDQSASYIEGLDLLLSAYPDYRRDYQDVYENADDMRQQIARDFQGYNSLETIWIALARRYKDRVDRDTIVHNVMDKIVDMFILDVTLRQSDRTVNNWYLVEYPSGRVDLAPIFDNARIFFTVLGDMRISLTVSLSDPFKNPLSNSLVKNITEFMYKSDESTKNRFLAAIGAISPESVDEIFASIEKKIECPIDEKTKDLYRYILKNQVEFLDNILEMVKKK